MDLHNDGTNDCVVDNQGNLYVVGSSEGSNASNVWDIIILKYNVATGDTIWTRRYNGPVNEDDEAADCVLDNSGNVFVVGYSSNGSNDDFLIIKYNTSSGDTIQTHRYRGSTNENDHARDCALDAFGNLYVTGFSENGADVDYLTVKFNAANGDTIWSQRYSGTTNGNDLATGCSLDDSSNLYVSGYSYNGLNYNILTLKYNENGDTLWTRKSTDTLDSLRFPQTNCITDSSGKVSVIGMCGINENFQNRYSLITKYNSSGDSIWVRKYDGPTSYDQPLGCTLDDSGDLYVTGQTETDSSNFDSFTIKYETTVTSVRESSNGRNISFVLEHNYPNPFNPSTTIEFSIPNSEFVTLKIYNILGQEVATLVSGKLIPGNYKYTWDAESLANGVYLYRIQAGNFHQVKKMMLLK